MRQLIEDSYWLECNLVMSTVRGKDDCKDAGLSLMTLTDNAEVEEKVPSIHCSYNYILNSTKLQL